VLRFGNITLDQTSFTLSSPTGSFPLASREYQMLEMLMGNPHRLISTEQFMDRIWGYDSDAEVNVVWVYISYLRKKLSALGASVQIRASRGLGYSLEESAKQ
jgi:DNA-binding response OmpR family regulator